MRYPQIKSAKKEQLVNLPDELILDILGRLALSSLLRCNLVCRRLKTVISSSAELSYLIELGVDGMANCADSSISYTERLQTVIKRRKAWSSMSWHKFATLHIPGESKAYELVDGVFAKLTGSHSFYAAYLPSARDADNTPERRIDLQLEFAARDFAMDPSQDLIIYLEDDERPPTYRGLRTVTLHVYSLSLNKPHPLGRSPKITFDILPAGQYTSNTIQAGFIQIAEDVVVVHYSTMEEDSHIILWNWMTGHQWLSRTFDNCMDFAFISPRAFFITSLEHSGSISIYSLQFDEGLFKQVPKANLISTLRLPPIRPLVWLDFIGAHTSPIVARPAPSKIAVPSLGSYIHVMSISYTHEGRDYPCSLFVPNYVLLSYAAREPSGIVEWADWGPRNIRFMERAGTSPWLRFVHGYRVVGPPLPSEHSGPEGFRTVVQVFDFNPYSSKVDQSAEASDHTLSTLSLLPTTIERRGLFQEDVVTSLPFRQTLCSFKERYSAFLIDDERIMALKYDSVFENDFDNVDVLAF